MLWSALLLSTIAGLSTTLGGYIACTVPDLTFAKMGRLQGAAAGVMVFLSYHDLFPEALRSVGPGTANIAVRFFFLKTLPPPPPPPPPPPHATQFFFGAVSILLLIKFVPEPDMTPETFPSRALRHSDPEDGVVAVQDDETDLFLTQHDPPVGPSFSGGADHFLDGQPGGAGSSPL
jgi:hypothetical protein